MQIHTRKLRNTFSIWQSTSQQCAHTRNQPSNSNFSQHREHVSCQLLHQFRSFSTGIKMIRKSDTPPPFLFGEERDKLEARVSTLFPCTAVCLALCMKQRQHFIRLGCKSYRARVYQRGVFAPATANSWNDSCQPSLSYPRGRLEFLEILSSVSNYRDKCSRWNQHRNISFEWRTAGIGKSTLFFFRVPSTNFLLFFFVPVRVVWKDRWIVGAWRFKWFLIKRCRSFFSLFFYFLLLLFSLRFSLGMEFFLGEGVEEWN